MLRKWARDTKLSQFLSASSWKGKVVALASKDQFNIKARSIKKWRPLMNRTATEEVCVNIASLRHALFNLGLHKTVASIDKSISVMNREMQSNLQASHPLRLSCDITDSMAREMAEIQRKRDRASRKKREKK